MATAQGWATCFGYPASGHSLSGHVSVRWRRGGSPESDLKMVKIAKMVKMVKMVYLIVAVGRSLDPT